MGIRTWIRCKIKGLHYWTCKAEQGIPPNDEELSDLKTGFWKYSRMYCMHCGTPSKLNKI